MIKQSFIVHIENRQIVTLVFVVTHSYCYFSS